MNNKRYSASDLPLSPSGSIYHLDAFPGNIAEDFILVGDPDRAADIANRPRLSFHGKLDGVEDPFVTHFQKQIDSVVSNIDFGGLLEGVTDDILHRGLRTITGLNPYSGRPVTIGTTGMGCPSTETSTKEAIALHETDFTTMSQVDSWKPLNFLRVGTSGAIQETTKLGTSIISKYAVGFGSGIFYKAAPSAEELQLRACVDEAIKGAMDPKDPDYGRILSFASTASPLAVDSLKQAADEFEYPHKVGITVSNDGFFANQGRDIGRHELAVPDFDGVMARLRPGIDDLLIENFEMEAATLFRLCNPIGHHAGAVCAGIANRRHDTWDNDVPASVERATRIALKALAHMREFQEATST